MAACLKCMGNNGFLSRLRCGETRDKASTAHANWEPRLSVGMEVCTRQVSLQFSECSNVFRIKYWGKTSFRIKSLREKEIISSTLVCVSFLMNSAQHANEQRRAHGPRKREAGGRLTSLSGHSALARSTALCWACSLCQNQVTQS